MRSIPLSKFLSLINVAVLISISCLMLLGCGPQHDPSPTDPIATGLTLTANPSLENQAINILSANCASCHSSVANGGVSNITDKNSLYNEGLIVPGNGNKGALMKSISPGGNMPLGSGSLSLHDVQTIQSWINSMRIVTSSP